MRPTFPLLLVTLLLSPSHHLSFLLFRLHFSPLTIFLRPPLLFIYTFCLCLSISVLFSVCASCLPVVNPITIYYCLLPLAKARTNAIVVGDSLAFCDKQRFMSEFVYRV